MGMRHSSIFPILFLLGALVQLAQTFLFAEENNPPTISVDGTVALGEWYDPGWSDRLAVTIDHTKVDANLVDFPLVLTGEHFAADFWNEVKEDGSDIVVTADDGITKLDRDIIEWDRTNQTMLMRVRLPFLSATSDTNLGIYYGNASASETNATGTYDTSLELYLPLHEDPSGTRGPMKDRTDGGWHGSSTGTMTTSDVVVGKVGNALEFDGINDRIETAVVSHGIGTGDFTFLAWVQRLSDTGQQYQGAMSNGDFSPAFYVEQNGDNQWGGYWGGALGASSENLNDTWYLLCMRRENGTITFYKDAQLEASSYDVTTSMANNVLRLGSSSASTANHGHQRIDEARLYSRALSGSELSTIYNNETSPATFYSISEFLSLPEDTDVSVRIKLADILVTDDGLGTNALNLSGTDAGLFEIDGTELYLSAGVNLDYETDNSLDVIVEINDAGLDPNPNDSVALAISVLDVNEVPVAGSVMVQRPQNVPIKLLIEDILLNASDVDGDVLTLMSVSAMSNQGAVLLMNDTFVLYNLPPGGNIADTFTYTVSDGFLNSTGEVSISIAPQQTGITFNLVASSLVDGKPKMTFACIPGYTYLVQRTQDLTGSPVWTTLLTSNVPASGLVHFTDDTPPVGDLFYRTIKQ